MKVINMIGKRYLVVSGIAMCMVASYIFGKKFFEFLEGDNVPDGVGFMFAETVVGLFALLDIFIFLTFVIRGLIYLSKLSTYYYDKWISEVDSTKEPFELSKKDIMSSATIMYGITACYTSNLIFPLLPFESVTGNMFSTIVVNVLLIIEFIIFGALVLGVTFVSFAYVLKLLVFIVKIPQESYNYCCNPNYSEFNDVVETCTQTQEVSEVELQVQEISEEPVEIAVI